MREPDADRDRHEWRENERVGRPGGGPAPEHEEEEQEDGDRTDQNEVPEREPCLDPCRNRDGFACDERQRREKRRADRHRDRVQRDDVDRRKAFDEHGSFSDADRSRHDREQGQKRDGSADLLPEDHRDPGDRQEGAENRPQLPTLLAVRQREEERQERRDRDHDLRETRLNLEETPVDERVAEAEVQDTENDNACERAPRREGQPEEEHGGEHQERRGRKTRGRSRERRELDVAESDRDRVRAPQDDHARERRKSDVVGASGGGDARQATTAASAGVTSFSGQNFRRPPSRSVSSSTSDLLAAGQGTRQRG